MSLHVITWSWGLKYGPDYVRKLFNGVAKNCRDVFRFLVVHPEPQDEYLTKIPGCLVRLRTFDPAWQADNGIAEGDRIVCLDLDLIITGELDPLFDRPEPFVILRNANQVNPNPLNGSIWMLTAGYRPDVWSDFSLQEVQKAPKFTVYDDQGWFWYKFGGDCPGWECGIGSGIWAFGKRTWPKSNDLPKDARMVCFPGFRDPAQFTHLPWVKRNWTA